MSTFKKIQVKLIETGTAITTKTIQRDCVWNSASNHASQPENHAMKKKRLNFGKRLASWDIDIEIGLQTFSVYKNTLILLFHDPIVHSCFANLHLFRDLTYRKL